MKIKGFSVIPTLTTCNDVRGASCDSPNSAHGVKRGCLFFFVYYKLINFKLVHSYKVKQLTCIIFYSSGLQNIYIQAPYMEVFNIYNIYIV